MMHETVLLPGGVLPNGLAYAALIDALGEGVTAHAKDLEVYVTDEPPPDYGLQLEIDGVLRAAEAAGFDRFHLVGYSAGGAISTAFTARYPDRVLSLALLEPAWMGNEGLSAEEREAWIEFSRISNLPAEELMPAFMRTQLAPGVEPPPPPPGPTPGWMAKRPAGIRALTAPSNAMNSATALWAHSSVPSTTHSARSADPITTATSPNGRVPCSGTSPSTSMSTATTSTLPTGSNPSDSRRD